MKMSKRCEDLRKEISEGIDAYNAAYKAGNLKAMTAAENAVKKAESEFASQAQLDLFSSHKDDKDPVYGILKDGFYGVVRHKVVREDGTLIGWVLSEDSERQVDIGKMFSYLDNFSSSPKSKVWKYRCERFTEILTEAVCEGVGQDTARMKDIFKMSDGARKIDVGPKATSNTQMLKLMQSCIDEIIMVPGEGGTNSIKCNNRDLKFIKECFSTEDKRARTGLKASKSGAVINRLGKVIYRITNNAAYSVDFQIVSKSESLEAQKAANSKAKAEKEAAKAEPAADVTLPAPTTEDAA